MLIVMGAPVGVLGLLDRRALPTGTGIEFERTASMFGGGSPALVVSGDDVAGVVRAIRSGPSVEDVTVVDDAGDEAVLRLTWDGTVSELSEGVRDAGGTVLSASARNDAWTFDLRFDDQGAASRFYTGYDDTDYPLVVHQMSPQGAVHRGSKERVTAEQREVLERAVAKGYFEVPRRTTLVELASEFGISDTAVSQRLRRGLAGVLRDPLYSSNDAHPTRGDR